MESTGKFIKGKPGVDSFGIGDLIQMNEGIKQRFEMFKEKNYNGRQENNRY